MRSLQRSDSVRVKCGGFLRGHVIRKLANHQIVRVVELGHVVKLQTSFVEACHDGFVIERHEDCNVGKCFYRCRTCEVFLDGFFEGRCLAVGIENGFIDEHVADEDGRYNYDCRNDPLSHRHGKRTLKPLGVKVSDVAFSVRIGLAIRVEQSIRKRVVQSHGVHPPRYVLWALYQI